MNDPGEHPVDAMIEPTVRSFLASLAGNLIDTIRHHKLPAVLSLAALIFASTAALNSHYDERPRYRQTILPDIQRAENLFFGTIEDARGAVNETWRLHYFLTAHIRARQALALAKSRWPRTIDGVRAHGELVRYYELVTEELAIIRTEMSVNAGLDYLREWDIRSADLSRVRQSWVDWIQL
jgi:hypothetical protein